MSIVGDKQKIFTELAALKTLNENFPSFDLTNSFPSINNKKDALSFLLDLAKLLLSYEEIKKSVVDLLTEKLSDIELKVKESLKLSLKEFVSCGINPSLPVFLKNTGVGLNFKLPAVDFINLMKISPTSDIGNLFYNDINAGINSTDFNTFLYNTVQLDSTTTSWGSSTGIGTNILDVKFTSSGAINNNINVKASSAFSTKKLTEFNNSFIDSISLFSNDKLINNVIDSIFGIISLNVGKTNTDLKREEELRTIIDKIIDVEEEDIIDDSFFQFSNIELQNIESTSKNRSIGLTVISGCKIEPSSVPITTIQNINNDLSTASTLIERKTIISSGLDTIGDSSAEFAEEKDKLNVRLGFIERFIKTMTMAIINTILSPKIIILFAINHKIVNGQTASFNDPIDFIKKNRTLIKSIVNSIKEIIITEITKKIIKEITSLIQKEVFERQKETSLATQGQLLSLVGVPQDVIRLIKNL